LAAGLGHGAILREARTVVSQINLVFGSDKSERAKDRDTERQGHPLFVKSSGVRQFRRLSQRLVRTLTLVWRDALMLLADCLPNAV
jgi:hypothetical protein